MLLKHCLGNVLSLDYFVLLLRHARIFVQSDRLFFVQEQHTGMEGSDRSKKINLTYKEGEAAVCRRGKGEGNLFYLFRVCQSSQAMDQ
jgi:hypothetical protein